MNAKPGSIVSARELLAARQRILFSTPTFTSSEERHTSESIKDKLLNSSGRELRRALFTLKQIFQDDKDLVLEFVQNGGLQCLIKVGSECDQNYQNYILRALGQIMLYVDGMNGVIAHNETIQWLYSLLASPYRLVVKTALKLLLVFVEYSASNSVALLAGFTSVDRAHNSAVCANLVAVLGDSTNSDVELLTIAMTLLNAMLRSLPDQDTFYDVVDSLEEQSIEKALGQLRSNSCVELIEQTQVYERMISDEDNEGECKLAQRGERRQSLQPGRRRASHIIAATEAKMTTSMMKETVVVDKTNAYESPKRHSALGSTASEQWRSPDSQGSQGSVASTSSEKAIEDFQHEFERNATSLSSPTDYSVLKTPPNLMTNGGRDRADESDDNVSISSRCPPPVMPNLDALDDVEAELVAVAEPAAPPEPPATRRLLVRAPAPTSTAIASSDDNLDVDDDADAGCSFASVLSRARRGMDAKRSAHEPIDSRKDSDIAWERAREKYKSRPLIINDLDFSALNDSVHDTDPLRNRPVVNGGGGMHNASGMPPPPPSLSGMAPPAPPPPMMSGGPPPPPPPMNGHRTSARVGNGVSTSNGVPPPTAPKTVKLHWKEAPMDVLVNNTNNKRNFWEKMQAVDIDQDKLAQLFETKTKEIPTKGPEKRQQALERKSDLRILSDKRSQVLAIGLTKLPPPRAIKQAILKFDSTILNKDGLEKILKEMLPSLEETQRLQEAQMLNPDICFGNAEQFLLLLSGIPDLLPRLKLWLFMIDYANGEKDVAEPLMDLKLAVDELETSATFKHVMATLLAVGNFLNGGDIKGFQLDYLAKVPEVKDTVHKHSLVHHLCSLVMEKNVESTDLYSELGAVARCAKVDFDEVQLMQERLEKDCRASWDYLKIVGQHESTSVKTKIGDYLNDCAERILTLKMIHRRMMNRFREFLLYMGMPVAAAKDTKVNAICKTVTEFALEYRNSRERIVQQKRRLLEKRERNKTRGKMWADNVPGAQTLPARGSRQHDDQRHDEMSRALLGGETGTSSDWRRQRLKPTGDRAAQLVHERNALRGSADDARDDEILDGLVKAATAKPDCPKETRRKARQFNRKSLRRTRTLKLVEDQIGAPVC